MGPRSRMRSWISAVALALAGTTAAAGDEPRAVIDRDGLGGKVLCGYQGWFRCPGDPAGVGWRHWSRDGSTISPRTLSVEMWPDMAEYGEDERYPAPGFAFADGSPASLFSSANARTVDRHFAWMRDYGIDGVFLQRFLVDLDGPGRDLVLGHVRAAAEASGRVYGIGYDLSGMPADRLYDRLTADWRRLVDDLKVTRDGRYLGHGGHPVVFVWGFYPDRFPAALAHRILDFFGEDGPYRATVIGGCPWNWRAEKEAEWARALRRFDVISPWNVGHYATIDGRRQAATDDWPRDRAEAEKAGMAYLPVIYPGFAWTNLKGERAANATIPRLGGEFFWKQFQAAARLGGGMAYVAMFDEVDEGTAIFKVANEPPRPGRFATYEGLPADWYLRLTGEGTKLIRGDRAADTPLPRP